MIVKEAVANGRLAGRRRIAALDDAARERRCTPDAVAIAAVLARPWVDVALSGAASSNMLASNLRALAIEWDEELEGRLGGLVEEPDAYWSERAALDWN